MAGPMVGPRAAPTVVRMAAPATRAQMVARMVARTAARTAVPMAVPMAVPTAGPTAARPFPLDRDPDLAGPGGALAPPGPAAVHEPRPGRLRRPLLVPPAAADARRRHRQLLHRPARPGHGRRAALP